jgi:hypothetical protein
MLSSTLRAAIALAIAFEVALPSARAETIECRERPETREYWSWREIDGRRCWYKGRRRTSKELLSWGLNTPAEAIKLDTTTAPTPPQIRSGRQSGAPGELVEVSEQHPVVAASPLGSFETAWRNAMADLKSQDGVKTVRTITVRTNAN